ncbi:MAG TPA: peptidoglycan editing factor PgeF [Thermodesulfobacteriota bacterium]|nr:peptidoglycan editing factor PgeF [Thermodesulfobacteriota bacterium]
MNTVDRSALKIKGHLPYFEIPEFASIGWIRHAFLTRQGGVSPPPYDSLNLGDKNGDGKECVSRNQNLIAKAFGFDSSRLVRLDQMHRDQILLLEKPVLPLPSPLEYDGLITKSPGVFLAILTADCLPIFVVDQKKKAIAAIHAGRQGTSLRIAAKALRKMREAFGCLSKDLLIAIGPSIGPFCYEIDEKVFQQEWKPFSTPEGAGKWRVDLAKINIAQMKAEGIPEEQIFRLDLCTHCHSDLYFSYRKEGRTGRQLSFIGILE